jgi:hypothetical protein
MSPGTVHHTGHGGGGGAHTGSPGQGRCVIATVRPSVRGVGGAGGAGAAVRSDQRAAAAAGYDTDGTEDYRSPVAAGAESLAGSVRAHIFIDITRYY